MRKHGYLVILIIFICTFIGTVVAYSGEYKDSNDPKKAMLVYTDTKSLPNEYTPDMARSKGDVVIENNKIYNKQKFEDFLVSIQKKNMDKVQIVVYTNEGDALIEQLYFDGETIVLITDNTRDDVTSSENRQINRYEALEIQKHTKKSGVLYVATLENGESFDIVYFEEIK
ncbi:MAG: DUF4362 domain-containing protein [Clostridium sp.]